MRRALWLLVLFLFLAPPVWSETYKIDPAHSQIQFVVDHLMVFKVRGFFTEFDGVIEADEKNRKLLSVKANIRTKSVDTRIEKRDNHLRSQDFFWSDKYPEMTFVSKKLVVDGALNRPHGVEWFCLMLVVKVRQDGVDVVGLDVLRHPLD